MGDPRPTLSPERVNVYPALRAEDLSPPMPAEAVWSLWELDETKCEARGETDGAGEGNEEGAVLIAVTDALSKDPSRIGSPPSRSRAEMDAKLRHQPSSTRERICCPPTPAQRHCAELLIVTWEPALRAELIRETILILW